MNEIFSYPLIYEGVSREFVRPNLTANGTMGGNSFAVYDNTFSNSWKAVDSSTSTYAHSSSRQCVFYFYNPTPLKVTRLDFTFTSNAINGSSNYFYVYRLKDGQSFSTNSSRWQAITIAQYPANSTMSTYTLLNNSGYYNYYAIQLTGYNNTYVRLVDLGITGEIQ